MYVYAIEGDSRRYTGAQICAVIREKSGRDIARYIITRAIPYSERRYGRASAYVAVRGGGGFRVRREEVDPVLEPYLYQAAAREAQHG